MWKSNRYLWKTEDGKIVEDGDPRSRFLFATPGMELNEKPKVEKPEAEKKAQAESEEKAQAEIEEKAVEGPPEDKSLKTKETK